MASVCFADPNNCFKKPKIVDWDGKKFFLCERTACCVSEGVSYMDDNGMHIGMFASAKLADETKAANDKYKDKSLKRIVLQAAGYTAPKKNASGKDADGMSKPPKPVYYSFIIKKAGKAKFDTEYLGKCTDIIGAIAQARNDTQPSGTYDLKLKLCLADPDYGTSITISKSASDPFVVVTSKPTPGGQYNLAESMEEAKRLRNPAKQAAQQPVETSSDVVAHVDQQSKKREHTSDVDQETSTKKPGKKAKHKQQKETTPPL